MPKNHRKNTKLDLVKSCETAVFKSDDNEDLAGVPDDVVVPDDVFVPDDVVVPVVDLGV